MGILYHDLCHMSLNQIVMSMDISFLSDWRGALYLFGDQRQFLHCRYLLLWHVLHDTHVVFSWTIAILVIIQTKTISWRVKLVSCCISNRRISSLSQIHSAVLALVIIALLSLLCTCLCSWSESTRLVLFGASLHRASIIYSRHYFWLCWELIILILNGISYKAAMPLWKTWLDHWCNTAI